MAILLECFSIIIPIANLKMSNMIEDVEGFLIEQRNSPSGYSFDKYLLRYPGGMNSFDLIQSLEFMKSQGFKLYQTHKGVKHWQDICVASSIEGPTLPCKWLEYDREKGIVWYAGTEPGTVIG